MKIIYLYQYFITPKGAGATRAYEMAKRLVRYGHEVHMITSDAGWMRKQDNERKKGWYETDEDGIHVHWYPVPYSNYMGFIARIKAFIKFMLAARKKAITIGGDIIFGTSAPLTIAIPAVHASKHNKIPMVFEVRDLWPEAPIQMGKLNNPLLRWVARRLEKYAYSNASRVIGLSPGMRDGIIAAGKPADLVEVIPNSSDLDLFGKVGKPCESAKKEFGVSGKFVFAYCGTMGEANGLSFVLDAASLLKKNKQKEIAFLLIGDGKERPLLEERIAREQLTNVVLVEPLPKSKIVSVFEACDVSMTIFKNVPVLRTCSPNKLFDSLAAGRPILTNMPGWLGDIAEKNQTGVLVQPDDVGDFVEKAMWMASHPDALKQFSVNARNVARDSFDREILAKRFEVVLSRTYEEFSNTK